MKQNIILGAGPAGLAAAHKLTDSKQDVIVLERDDINGGLSKTVKYDKYYFDLGGHRFFTKNQEVKDFWHQTLDKDLVKRPRLSRIYYNKKFFYYPIKPANALKQLGLIKSVQIGFSYLWVRIKYSIKPKEDRTFTDWVTRRFGKVLFNTFFKSYTEKVWGISTDQIGAEWAAQRIKGLSLWKAATGFLHRDKTKIKTLIEEFEYPRRGPGMMYEKIAENVEKQGGKILNSTKVIRVNHQDNKVLSVVVSDKEKNQKTISGDNFISSIPLNYLLKVLYPRPSQEVIEANKKLRFRAFLTVGLILDKEEVFPDNWIYIHDPEVAVARIQNFKNWSEDMCSDKTKTNIGMEYICWQDDDLWNSSNENLIKRAKIELEKTSIAKSTDVIDGFVIRVPEAYPVYESGYKESLKIIYDYLGKFGNLQLIGRSGMYRYNNMDHSILTGFLAAKNILGEKHDVFSVNMEQEYHEG